MKKQISSVKKPLPRSFYVREPEIVAPELLGKQLVHRTAEGETSGLIVEVEAYLGREDAASHSYLRKSPSGNLRTNVMFSEGGVAYVYLIYGMYCCFNTVVNVQGNPQGVLIRAIEPTQGIPLMQERRLHVKNKRKSKSKKDEQNSNSDMEKPFAIRNLCNGPGKLCIAMGITLNQYGCDLCGEELFLTEGESIDPTAIAATPRINVEYAGEAAAHPLRFVVRESPFLSTKKFLNENSKKE